MRGQAAEAGQLAQEARVPAKFPKAHGAKVARPEPPPPPRSPLTAAEVAAGWASSGGEWIDALGRRELVAAVRLLGAHVDGRALIAREGLANALLSAAERRLRGPRFVDVLASVWFMSYPPPPALTARLERARGEIDPAMLPRWLREFGSHPMTVLRRLGPNFRTLGHEEARTQLDVPPALIEGTWADELVRQEIPASIEDVQRLLLLADRGRVLRAPAAVPEGVRHVARAAVGFGRRAVEARRGLVALLRGRVGDLFGETSRPRWTGMEEQLRILRSWVAGEFMDVIFQHVHPDGLLSHQLAPRRDFWRRYGGSVERLTVYVKGGRAQLLRHPEVERIVKELEGMVRIGALDSPTGGHAILLMEMAGTTGSVTVVEGNSSAKVRIRPEAVKLPVHRISYRDDITQGEFSESLAFTRMHDEPGHWKGIVRSELARYGIRETTS